MLNNLDAARVAKAIGACFAEIARCEQHLHATARASVLNGQEDDPEALHSALEAAHAAIETELEKCQLADADILSASGWSAHQLLAELDRLARADATPKSESEPLARRLAPFITSAGLVDSWLEPAFNLDMDLNAVQGVFRDAFSLDGQISLEGGVLLPRHYLSWRSDEDGRDSFGLFARYLRHVTYIPSLLDCDDPNVLRSPGNPITVGYHLWNSSSLQARPMPDNPKVAVAPLAERGCDVSFVPSTCRTKYALQLAYDETRFANALALALEQGVHILLVPEMALPEGDPADFGDRMRNLFLEVNAAYFGRTGKVGELRLVMAGVLGGIREDGYHRNYVVAFDGSGEQPDIEQLKLAHWNLTRREQDQFAITHHQRGQPPLADPIGENSLPAESLTVLEIPGVGRTATLICADMSQDNPGDWLSLNAVLDWLYAPIMDKSTCWDVSDQLKKKRPWIVRRTYRTARLTRTLVITTNSIALTRWTNEAFRLGQSTWPVYDKAGIGLALDGRRCPPTYSHLSVPIDEQNVVKSFALPTSDWDQFPKAP